MAVHAINQLKHTNDGTFKHATCLPACFGENDFSNRLFKCAPCDWMELLARLNGTFFLKISPRIYKGSFYCCQYIFNDIPCRLEFNIKQCPLTLSFARKWRIKNCINILDLFLNKLYFLMARSNFLLYKSGER